MWGSHITLLIRGHPITGGDGMKDYGFKISVIMALYNVANYLDEAIESIINQSIGFEENIQLILVNDGSPDNLDVICRKYKELYPNNIVYIEQPNGGVSSARNAGMKFIEGKYATFFDGDDIWDVNAFAYMYDYIEKNYDKVDFVSARHYLFGRRNGFLHPLDYKFERTRIVDINVEYNCVQSVINTTLIKSSVIAKYQFDTRLKIAEDAALATLILFEKMAYGIVREAVYYYRKREAENSAMDYRRQSLDWYFDTTCYFNKMILDESLRRVGSVVPYVQFLAMYEIQTRLLSPMPKFFSDADRQKYRSIIIELLNYIDDRIILEQKNINIVAKIFALSLKHQTDITKSIYLKKHSAYYDGMGLFSVLNKNRLRITNMDIREDVLHIEGISQLHLLSDDYSLIIKADKGRTVPVEYYRIENKDVIAFTGDIILEGRGIRAAVPLDEITRIRFYLVGRNGDEVALSPSFGQFAKLNNEQDDSYYSHGNFIVKNTDKGLRITKRSSKRSIAAEFRYIKNTLLPNHKYKLAVMRTISLICRAVQRKPIWIISDRTNVAGDNGEALFTYLCSLGIRDKRIYFAIDQKSPDYGRVMRIGNVLRINSFRYKLFFLLADKIISAHADDWVINAFGEDKKYMNSLYDFDYIFLQHGIIKDDLSGWLHKTKKNIRMFVTSSVKEYESIIDGSYGYTSKEVVLSGLPRYDKLVSRPEKKIVFLPTWRKNLAGEKIAGTSSYMYSDTFKETNYCKLYNHLINDKRLIEAMKAKGYEGVFYVHPAIFAQSVDFNGNDTIRVAKEDANYQKLFRENSLLITDYSSVAFDFAYMKKPVVYFQFDYDTFFDCHIYKKSYFDYQKDAFGPVCYSYEDTINAIIMYIENDCAMEESYMRRVDNFFMWTDRNNCKRAYEAIEAIGNSNL